MFFNFLFKNALFPDIQKSYYVSKMIIFPLFKTIFIFFSYLSCLIAQASMLRTYQIVLILRASFFFFSNMKGDTRLDAGFLVKFWMNMKDNTNYTAFHSIHESEEHCASIAAANSALSSDLSHPEVEEKHAT